MKKLFLLFAVATMSLSIYSCRETTEENAENDMEEIGNDIENSAEEAGEDIERTTEEAGNEIEAEVEGTDDM
ncbi:hypothetical protein RM549_04850 [Salegentibacter sp. F188]|uniref:Secreted protein n=1 Tax=Autumnicola patrickiae TaxID=3075591 RepID=A0ABU3DZI1_9FLAO|nr:hypothetical protein [Salegentibacter sp. F188]MDT0689100.1 hypothetical protein [Salegentibacter sp. F188]